MPLLLDTCALSEFVAPEPNPAAIERLLALPRDDLYVSVMTIGELQQGIAEMDPCKRKSFLEGWLENHVIPLYVDRTVLIDVLVAREWGKLAAALTTRGRKMQVKDSLIAATAIVHDMTVVTRNESDFAPSGVRILNPWR